MKHFTLFSFLGLLAFGSMPKAYCDDFKPIHFEPSVYISYDETSIKLRATYYGSGKIAPHQKLYVKFLALGKRPETQEGIMGIPVVAAYDENEVPIAVSTEMETDDKGRVEIYASLKPGRYQLVVSYDGLKGTGWQPMRIPLKFADYSSPCIIRPVIHTEKSKKLYKSGAEIPMYITYDSSCHAQNLTRLSVEVDDGAMKSVIPLEADKKHFNYKSARDGSFPVNVVVNPVNDEDTSENSEYSIIHPSPSIVRIGLGDMFYSEKATIYYYDELTKREANIINNFFTTKVQYEPLEETKDFDFSDVKLQLCVPNTEDCFMPEKEKSWAAITFDVPTNITGPMKPTLFIGDEPYDIPLPIITLPHKTARNVTGISVLVLICLAIVIRRVRKQIALGSKLPKLPKEFEIHDDQLCKSFIRQCFEVVSKQYCFVGIDWNTDTVETYYQGQSVLDSVKNNHAFEKYCFYIHLLLGRDSFTLEDLKTVRRKSLGLLK